MNGDSSDTPVPSSIESALIEASEKTEPATRITTRPPARAFAPPRLPNIDPESELQTLIKEAATSAATAVSESIHDELRGARRAVEEFVKEHRVSEFSRLRAEERRAYEFKAFASTTQHEFQKINERLVEGNDRFDRIEERQRANNDRIERMIEAQTAHLLLSSRAQHLMQEGRLTGISVLVVEDEPSVREAIGRVLGSAGADVRLVSDLAAARTELARLPPGTVVVDLTLGGEDGMLLVRELRAATSPRIGVVIATGLISFEDEQEARALGAYVILKPYESGALVEAVHATAAEDPGA